MHDCGRGKHVSEENDAESRVQFWFWLWKTSAPSLSGPGRIVLALTRLMKAWLTFSDGMVLEVLRGPLRLYGVAERGRAIPELKAALTAGAASYHSGGNCWLGRKGLWWTQQQVWLTAAVVSNTQHCIVHATCYKHDWSARPMSTPASRIDTAESDFTSKYSQCSAFQSICFVLVMQLDRNITRLG